MKYVSEEALFEVMELLPVSVSEETLPEVKVDDLKDVFAVINVGLKSFYDSFKSQDAKVVHVDWRPPAGGNEKLMSILERMKAKSKTQK